MPDFDGELRLASGQTLRVTYSLPDNKAHIVTIEDTTEDEDMKCNTGNCQLSATWTMSQHIAIDGVVSTISVSGCGHHFPILVRRLQDMVNNYSEAKTSPPHPSPDR